MILKLFLSDLDFWGFLCWFIFIYIIHCKYSFMCVQNSLIWEAALYGNQDQGLWN